MKNVYTAFSTGLPYLDKVFTGLHPGDNVVWQVNTIDDYIAFVHPFCKEAYNKKQSLIYFRFAQHKQLIPEGVEAEVYQLHPEDGFENFISEIFDVIEKFGIGVCYVFDCLSGLSVDWYSDRMLGNFFMLTCPYLYTYETATYFALFRNTNTSMAIDAIHNTAQVVLDVYNNKNKLYVHPLKVFKRYSDTMYLLHSWEVGDKFHPVTKSATISEILGSIPQPWLNFTVRQCDIWTQTFMDAYKVIENKNKGITDLKKEKCLINRLLRMAITRDERVLKLAEKYFDLEEILNIGKRMIGTGLIGGKSVGMLLARAILKKSDKKWEERLEPHDSFFIGSDVFYTYLIRNGCWWVRRRLKNPALAIDGSHEARQRMLTGTFSNDIKDQFMSMLNYFGQSPIIVRSSSLLEDAYGNAFSGKYESIFCANQGSPEERLDNFITAVRKVYASTMSKDALHYRYHWDLLDRDEQMAILVQRVSGESFNSQFYPHVAGVGFSFNPFVWNKEIDPKAGFLRLVFGLGTRAVDRSDDDYTRIVSLNAPKIRPESNIDEVRKYTQRRVDILDLRANQQLSKYFEDVVKDSPKLPIDIFATHDETIDKRAAEMNYKGSVFSWILTFEKLLQETTFVSEMRSILDTIHAAYDNPVDIEFTTNFIEDNKYRINLLQCRPFQTKGQIKHLKKPKSINEKQVILKTAGPIIGNSIDTKIDRIIYVECEAYSNTTLTQKYSIARLIGRLTHLEEDKKAGTILLMGPGRWGSSSPELGIPVSFNEINKVAVLCEIAYMREGLIPDVSLGTHFFNDLVEMDMLYLAIYPEKANNILNIELLKNEKNQLLELLPDATAWEHIVHVVDNRQKNNNESNILLFVDAREQSGVCFIK